MDNYRKLIVLGLNEALTQGRITLEAPPDDAPTDENGHIFCELAGYPSVVIWNSISVGELRISVWWNYDYSKHPQASSTGTAHESFKLSRPLAKKAHYPKFVGATASAWLERQTAKHLQGRGKDNIFDKYLRIDMKNILQAVPDPVPQGYEAEGQFFL